jgi:hypothetical protein
MGGVVTSVGTVSKDEPHRLLKRVDDGEFARSELLLRLMSLESPMVGGRSSLESFERSHGKNQAYMRIRGHRGAAISPYS